MARLALECGVPVVPVGISGTDRIQPRGSRWFRPFRPVRVSFGPPMTFDSAALVDAETGRTSNERLRSFTDELMAEIARLADRPYVDELAGRAATGRTSTERLRSFTDELMAEISRLAHRPYVDELAGQEIPEVDLGPAEASAS